MLTGRWLLRLIGLATIAFGCASGSLLAQHEGHQMPAGPTHSRAGSGTSWLPDSSPTHHLTSMRGRWMLTLHGAVFGQYVDQGTQRGDRQLGLVDWEMGMAMRPLAGGTLGFRGMTSMQALVIGGDGYPLLLQTGGNYKRGYVHDRQHSHDVLMEVAAMYERPIAGRVGLSFYVAPVGEPALGPVAPFHRPSAENDPAAPLGNHWQNATHISYGVATFGIGTRSLKIEGSAFNARESDHDEPWPDFRRARLDSWSGRISWAASRVAVSSWWGYITAHDPYDPEMRMHRYGGSLATQLRGIRGGSWASTAVWGMNLHHHSGSGHLILHGDPNASPHQHSSSLLLETNLGIGTRTAVFGRVERVMKNGQELGFLGGNLMSQYDVRSVVAGFRRQIVEMGSVELALGARAAVNFVPQALEMTYGTRTPTGFTVFAQLRPK